PKTEPLAPALVLPRDVTRRPLDCSCNRPAAIPPACETTARAESRTSVSAKTHDLPLFLDCQALPPATQKNLRTESLPFGVPHPAAGINSSSRTAAGGASVYLRIVIAALSQEDSRSLKHEPGTRAQMGLPGNPGPRRALA